MYLHLGQDVVIRKKDIIGIYDIDNTTISRHARDFLAACQKSGKVITTTNELPKSFIVCNENGNIMVYISQISASTLQKRNVSGMDEIFSKEN